MLEVASFTVYLIAVALTIMATQNHVVRPIVYGLLANLLAWMLYDTARHPTPTAPRGVEISYGVGVLGLGILQLALWIPHW